jgi:hypothetical protein
LLCGISPIGNVGVASWANVIGHALGVAAVLCAFTPVLGAFTAIFVGIFDHGWREFRPSAWVRNGRQYYH